MKEITILNAKLFPEVKQSMILISAFLQLYEIRDISNKHEKYFQEQITNMISMLKYEILVSKVRDEVSLPLFSYFL